MEDFQCLWKVHNFSKAILICSKSIKNLFSHFYFSAFHHFLSSCLSSFLPTKKKTRITHNLPNYSGALRTQFIFLLPRLTQLLGLMCSFSCKTIEGLNNVTEFSRSLKCVNEGIAYLKSPWIELSLKLCLHVKKTTRTLTFTHVALVLKAKNIGHLFLRLKATY